MENMEVIQIKNAFGFANSLVMEGNENMRILFQFINRFKEIYNKEKECLPYHINLIDELHINENAHSRIFAKLLRFKENDKFPFLEKFLYDICKFKLTVEKPEIKKVDSCGRIDIPIFDNNYVIIIENKVTDKASDQNKNGGQLARYIETIRQKYGKDLKDIFVIYTPKYTREPSDACWINKDDSSYKSDFKQRFCSLSYRDKIYPWLKNKILNTIHEKDIFLRSAIEQYVDYLEGIFSLRTINKRMNMKLQDFIKKELNLEDDKPVEAVKALSEKEEELQNAITQIQQMKNKYNKQIILENFDEWENLLQVDFPSFKIVGDKFKLDEKTINVGVEFTLNNECFVAIIECNNWNNKNIYLGISRHYVSTEKYKVPDILQEILDKNELVEQANDYWWYGWKYSALEDAYSNLKNLIEKIDAKID